jgi:hypothetical protein
MRQHNQSNGWSYSSVNADLEIIIMDKGHITVRCLLHDLSYHEYGIRLKKTYNSDILEECVKGILILRNVRQRSTV